MLQIAIYFCCEVLQPFPLSLHSRLVNNAVFPLIYNLSQGTIKKKDWRKLPAALVLFHLTET